MAKSPLTGPWAGLVQPSRWRRATAALLALAAGALAVGVILGADLTGSSKGASQSKATGSASVQRRDLVATDTQSGTLSYANPHTVFNRLSGTITSLPTVGKVIKPGQTLYQVDGAPVVLLNGTVPAYRSLSAGVTDGLDVQELKQNLVALGFDSSHQITINQTFDAATTAAVDLWQGSLGQTQTGTVTLGQVVFLPGSQRITAVNAALGGTGGASTGAASASGSGTATGASTTVAPRPLFVSLTSTPTTAHVAADGQNSSTQDASAAAGSSCPPAKPTKPKAQPKPTCNTKPSSSGSSLAALIALLKAETLELQKSRSSASTPSSSSGSTGRSGASGASGASSGASSAGGSSAGASSAGTSSAGASSGAAAAQAVLQTTSTQEVVTVNLDATKQTEAVIGEAVTVQLPDGSTVNGKITNVSPVAQSTSSSTTGGAAGSSTPSATVPVTVGLSGHQRVTGLDQAAVSVNFQQQKATNVLSVPVTALIATAGGGYAVQESAAPRRLIPVTPGLFAAGYVQISGAGISEGLQVTDSQG